MQDFETATQDKEMLRPLLIGAWRVWGGGEGVKEPQIEHALPRPRSDSEWLSEHVDGVEGTRLPFRGNTQICHWRLNRNR